MPDEQEKLTWFEVFRVILTVTLVIVALAETAAHYPYT
jgi:hypothetical protein